MDHLGENIRIIVCGFERGRRNGKESNIIVTNKRKLLAQGLRYLHIHDACSMVSLYRYYYVTLYVYVCIRTSSPSASVQGGSF